MADVYEHVVVDPPNTLEKFLSVLDMSRVKVISHHLLQAHKNVYSNAEQTTYSGPSWSVIVLVRGE